MNTTPVSPPWPPLRSNFPVDSMRSLARRAEWKPLGINPEHLDRPKVAIVNTSNDLAACFAHLDEIVVVLKEELRSLGVLPLEIRTSAPSDFITSVGQAGRYVLPARDLITNDIEVMVEGAQLDGMICLSSCDKTTPAHLMAAGRLNVPTVIIPCGYQHSGLAEGGGADIEEVFLQASYHSIRGGDQGQMEAMADSAIRGPGVCAGLATANSMHMIAEVLGMAVSGAAPVRAGSEPMWDSVRRSAAALVHALRNSIRPRDVITAGAIQDAVTVMLSVGASVNTIKHLQAVAVEAGLDIDVWEAFRTQGRRVPLLASIRPNGPHLIEDLEDAGGTATILRELAPLLSPPTERITVTGETLAERIGAAPPADGTIIRGLDDPYSTDPSIVVLRGSLAATGSVSKRPIPDPGPYTFTGPARIFHSREEGIEAVAAGTVQAGDVVVLRGLGLEGGPGMGFVSGLIFALEGAGLAGRVGFVTDGQYSGLANSGVMVGEVSPEAATGGAIGLLQDGDPLAIDLRAGTIDVLVDPAVLQARPPFRQPAEHQPDAGPVGYLDLYRRAVQPLACGAVLCPRPGVAGAAPQGTCAAKAGRPAS
ncbi:dihydroxy-acid dehydratase [Citricoccus sp.]|uniref:dihydroxy-acid dehydratase domain-containing protein n=1 Tax=Citricoccus sp. TaxID=1978372 RepID=UPI0028BD7F22|nr:dihydroxy-acid dehydratase [Citricoccus sp.]